MVSLTSIPGGILIALLMGLVIANIVYYTGIVRQDADIGDLSKTGAWVFLVLNAFVGAVLLGFAIYALISSNRGASTALRNAGNRVTAAASRANQAFWRDRRYVDPAGAGVAPLTTPR